MGLYPAHNNIAVHAPAEVAAIVLILFNKFFFLRQCNAPSNAAPLIPPPLNTNISFIHLDFLFKTKPISKSNYLLISLSMILSMLLFIIFVL